jgi:hypothetical protein
MDSFLDDIEIVDEEDEEVDLQVLYIEEIDFIIKTMNFDMPAINDKLVENLNEDYAYKDHQSKAAKFTI